MFNFLKSRNDPRELYDKPPFKKQPQESPETASAMDPVPDHGKKSHRGSGKLNGRKALIIGGGSESVVRLPSYSPESGRTWLSLISERTERRR